MAHAMTRAPRALMLALLAAIVATALAAAAMPAAADAVTRRHACFDGTTAGQPVQSIFVRNNLAEKRGIAILYRGETFDIHRSVRQSNGALWFYGFAYGGENVWGWVYQGWLTGPDGLCPDGRPA